MGRQILVKLSRKKEKEFSKFLKENEGIFMIRWNYKKEIKFLNEIPKKGSYVWTIYIGNKQFKFIPDFIKLEEQSKYNKYNYAFDKIGKPLIEYSRGPMYRIYWERDYLIDNPLYDLKEFEIWFNKIIYWIKKNCKNKNGVYIG